MKTTLDCLLPLSAGYFSPTRLAVVGAGWNCALCRIHSLTVPDTWPHTEQTRQWLVSMCSCSRRLDDRTATQRGQGYSTEVACVRRLLGRLPTPPSGAAHLSAWTATDWAAERDRRARKRGGRPPVSTLPFPRKRFGGAYLGAKGGVNNRGLPTLGVVALSGRNIGRAWAPGKMTSMGRGRALLALIPLRNCWMGVAVRTPGEVKRGAGGCAGPR